MKYNLEKNLLTLDKEGVNKNIKGNQDLRYTYLKLCETL